LSFTTRSNPLGGIALPAAVVSRTRLRKVREESRRLAPGEELHDEIVQAAVLLPQRRAHFSIVSARRQRIVAVASRTGRSKARVRPCPGGCGYSSSGAQQPC
jgi:hypothetical protein